MRPTEILRKMVARGSEALVRALYDRLRAGPGARPAGRQAPRAPTRPKRWSALLDQAVGEGALTGAEARRLLARGTGPLRRSGRPRAAPARRRPRR